MARRANILILLLSCSVQAVTVTPSLNSFNGGELSPLMISRSDFTKYNNACRLLRNMHVLSQGPVTRRPGTKYIAETETMSERSRLIPFEFSKTDTYMIEAGDLYMRFYRNGGQIIDYDGSEDLSAVGSIVAHWKLNDDAASTAVVDADGATHDGVASANTDTFNDTGVTSGALDMDGQYYATVTDSVDFTFDDSADDAFSIMAWVYIESSNHSQTIISKWDETTGSEAREWSLFIGSLEAFEFWLYDETNNQYGRLYTDFGNPISEGWHFIVVSYDGRGGTSCQAGMNIYIDNTHLEWPDVHTLSGATYSQMRNTGAAVIIGALENSAGSMDDIWENKLDNIAVFDKELTVTEIAALWDTTADAYEITTTYTESEVSSLQYVQIADTMYIVHSDHEPRKLTRTGHTAWAIADVGYSDGPFMTENKTSTTVTPSATTGSITLSSSASLFSAGHIGALFKIVHPVATLEYSDELDDNYTSDQTEDVSWLDCGTVYEGTTWYLTTLGTWTGTLNIQRNYTIGAAHGAAGWEDAMSPFASTDDRNVSTNGTEEVGDASYRAILTESGDNAEACKVYFSTNQTEHIGIVRITAYASGTSTTATVLKTIASTAATHKWSEGYWSPKNGYPATIEFHEFRLFYGGNANYPQTIWASKSGDEDDYESMSLGTNDDDALIYDLPGQNPIQFMHSHDYLVIGTLGGVGRLGDIDEPFTPDNAPQYRQQTPYGSAFLPAISTGDAILYVGRGGTKVREFAYSLERDRFVSPDMTVLAEHITGDGIVDVAYQIRPDSVLWCVLDDGDMATMTYQKDHDVFGWSLQITDGDYESVAIIPGDDEDEVWTIVNRTVDSNEVRYIEQFQPRDWGSDDTDCYFVDSGLSWDGGDAESISGASKANPCVITVSSWPTDGDGTNLADGDQVKVLSVAGMTELNGNIYTVDDADVSAKTFSLDNSAGSANVDSTSYTTYTSGGTVQRFEKDFSNLGHVEGKAVAVFADGEAVTNNTVSSGAIETSNWHNKVIVGLPYTSIIETMPLVFNTQRGSTSSKYKRLINVSFDFYETLGLSFGIDEDNLTTKDFDDMTTGWKEYRFPYGQMRPATIYIETAKPIPLCIREIIPELEIDD